MRSLFGVALSVVGCGLLVMVALSCVPPAHGLSGECFLEWLPVVVPLCLVGIRLLMAQPTAGAAGRRELGVVARFAVVLLAAALLTIFAIASVLPFIASRGHVAEVIAIAALAVAASVLGLRFVLGSATSPPG